MLKASEVIFSSIRPIDGRCPFEDLHWKRLGQACQWAWPSLCASAAWEKWKEELNTFLGEGQANNLVIRLELRNVQEQLQLTINTRPYVATHKALSLSSFCCPRLQDELPSFVKILNYKEADECRKLAIIKGHDEAFFVDQEGYVLEAATSNIFILRHGKIFTPALRKGILAGVAREIITQAFEAEEVAMPRSWLDEASEVWLTNAVRGVIPIKQVDDRIYTCQFGEKVKKYWSKSIGLEC